MTPSDWVARWGEVVTKVKAAKMLGLSERQVYYMIERGELKTASDGRVLVWSAAEWALGADKSAKKRFIS